MTFATMPELCRRAAPLAVALLLGACVEVPLFHTGSDPETPAQTPAAASAAAPREAPVAQAAVRPPPAARAQSAPAIPPEPAADGETPTIETVRAECWMKLEADRKAPRDLDKRVRLVAACVDEKSKALAAQGVPLAQ